MKILIVDDEISKASEISRIFEGVDFPLEIEHFTTATAARRALQSTKYALIIIDLHLPAALQDMPAGDGGFDLLDLIALDAAERLPVDVVFITGRDELLSQAKSKALERGAVLFEYAKKTEWSQYLIGRAKHLSRLDSLSVPLAIDIAVVTALYSPELEAVLKLPYSWVERRFNGDPINYHFGEIVNGDRTLRIVATSAHRKGMPSSAALASHIVSKFRPKYLVMLGICAGLPKKTNFGDVIIADPTWDYGSGKHAVDNKKSSIFLAAPYQVPLASEIRTLAEQIARDSTVIQKIRSGWKGDVPQGTLSAFVAPMASGASVIADDEQARKVALQQREVLGIEMEAYAVMAAMEYAVSPKPIAFVIKSVCDFADSKKNDKWQSYAAYTSAAFADHLFRSPSLP